MTATSRIDVNDVEGTKVIRFNDRQLFDERVVKEAADQITAALPPDGQPIRLILDFSNVSLISSSLLSKLIILQKKVEGTKGRMRLCELSGVLQSVFRTSNLDRLFSIDRDRRSSIESMC